MSNDFFLKIGKQLIAYIKAWTFVLNEQAIKYGLVAFDMNTYTIAMLVIFYLQMNHELPIVTELASTIASKVKFSSENQLDEFVKEFFEFYGKKFAPKAHLISINVGKWQQKTQVKQRFVFLCLFSIKFRRHVNNNNNLLTFYSQACMLTLSHV